MFIPNNACAQHTDAVISIQILQLSPALQITPVAPAGCMNWRES